MERYSLTPDPIPPAVEATLWAAHEDTVRQLLPALGVAALHEVAADLRPGSGGRWGGLPPEAEARRQLLLADIVARVEGLTGRPWPFLDDLLPGVPDVLPGDMGRSLVR